VQLSFEGGYPANSYFTIGTNFTMPETGAGQKVKELEVEGKDIPLCIVRPESRQFQQYKPRFRRPRKVRIKLVMEPGTNGEAGKMTPFIAVDW
jgi:hypothetical protein